MNDLPSVSVLATPLLLTSKRIPRSRSPLAVGVMVALVLVATPMVAKADRVISSDRNTTPGSTPESWIVNNQATLTLRGAPGFAAVQGMQVLDGAGLVATSLEQIDSLEARDGSSVSLNQSTVHLKAGGVNVGGGIAVEVNSSSFKSANTSIISELGIGLSANNLSTGVASTAELVNSSVSGLGRGLNISGGSSVLLSGSSVKSQLGGRPFAFDGAGVALWGGALNATNGSSMVGEGAGLYISTERPGSTNAASSVRLDASSIEGMTGSAIVVESTDVSYEPAVADIYIANGSKLIGGNGTILEVNGGTTANLAVDSSSLQGNIVSDALSTANVALSAGSTLTGSMTGASNVVIDNSSWTVTGDSDVDALRLNGGGVVSFEAPTSSTFKTLTVHGDFNSAGGLLIMNARLEGDGSLRDHLLVEGNTTGLANLQVNNVGGAGAQTAEGIQVIQVNGQSDGQFTLSGRAVGGQYEYFLFKGGIADPNDGDWYLRSQYTGSPVDPCVVDPNGPTCPVKPVDPVDPCLLDPASCPEPEIVIRPEPGAYLVNQAAAINLFDHSMHDRLGEPAFDGEARGAWARVSRQQADYGHIAQQLKVDSNSSVLQVGTDVFGWDQAGRGRVGVMLGAGRADTHATSTLTGYSAKGRVDGGAVGAYGTWFQNADIATGLYVDGVVQYARYKNSVEGVGLAEEKYDSHSWSGSVEAGYAFEVMSTDKSRLFVEPQVQVRYTDYTADSLTEKNGTVVKTEGGASTESRLGVRIHGRTAGGRYNLVQPFVTLNWLHGESLSDAIAFDGDRLTGGAPKDRYEAKAGVELQLRKNVSAWGSFGVQKGQGGYRNIGGQLGMKFAW